MSFFNAGSGRGYLWGGIADALSKLYMKNLNDEEFENKKKLEELRYQNDTQLMKDRYEQMRQRDKDLYSLRDNFNKLKLDLDKSKHLADISKDHNQYITSLLNAQAKINSDKQDLETNYALQSTNNEEYNTLKNKYNEMETFINSELSKYKNNTQSNKNTQITKNSSARDELYKLLNSNI